MNSNILDFYWQLFAWSANNWILFRGDMLFNLCLESSQKKFVNWALRYSCDYNCRTFFL